MEVLGQKEHEAYALSRDRRYIDLGTRYVPEAPKVVTPDLLRQLFAGALDMSTLPAALAGQLRTIARRIERQQFRAAKRQHHARNHYVTARNGGGQRECERRLGPILSGKFKVANGLVSAGAWTDAQFGKVAVL